MQVNNTSQCPQPKSTSFGMALKISKGAREALNDCSMDTIEKLQKAGEELKDTKFFHVKVNDDLSAKIDSDENAYFGFFKNKDYSASRHGITKSGGKEVPDDRIIMIEDRHGTIAGVGRYVPYAETKPIYDSWGVLGPYNHINDIKYLTKIAKILDNAAIENYNKSLDKAELEKLERAKVSKAIDNLLDTYGE